MAQDITQHPASNPPIKPSLAPPLRSLGESKSHPIYGEHGYEGESETYTPPAVVTPAQAVAARKNLAEYDHYLAPIDTQRCLAQITTALAHHYVPDLPDGLGQAVLADWLTDLAGFPEWAIAQALADWRRIENKRPTIAAIRDRCQRATRKAAQERYRLRAILSVAEKPKQTQQLRHMPAPKIKRMPTAATDKAKPEPILVAPASPEQIAEWARQLNVAGFP